jgi:hypothetical protein
VTIVCLCSQSTHKLQSLDELFIGPLEILYIKEVQYFLQSQGCHVNHLDVAEIFARSYFRAPTMKASVNGFKGTGVYPMNGQVYGD